jgi:ABC-type glutathione transport system ATPase component
MFPKTIDIKLESPVYSNFRCQVAANSLDIDVSKKNIHHLKIDNVNIPKNWNVGLIYGASGSGKTTTIKKLFGENIFQTIINEDEPIINQLQNCWKFLGAKRLMGKMKHGVSMSRHCGFREGGIKTFHFVFVNK